MQPIQLTAASVMLGLLLLTGCQSAKQPGGTSHASVQIQGRSVAEIQQAATVVFQEEGYMPGLVTPQEMVFDRPGSRQDALKWGGLASGQGVTMRVKIRMSEYVGSSLLQADAYAVQNSADPFFQTESRNILLNQRPYQKLLNKVAKRLK